MFIQCLYINNQYNYFALSRCSQLIINIFKPISQSVYLFQRVSVARYTIVERWWDNEKVT